MPGCEASMFAPAPSLPRRGARFAASVANILADGGARFVSLLPVMSGGAEPADAAKHHE